MQRRAGACRGKGGIKGEVRCEGQGCEEPGLEQQAGRRAGRQAGRREEGQGLAASQAQCMHRTSMRGRHATRNAA
jgi:hypothetical protein